MKLLPIQEQEAVLRRENRRRGRVGGKIGNARVHRLALVRRERRDIDERRHIGVSASPADYCPAVGVADKNDRFALRVDDALGRGHVAFERQRRILDDADLVTVLPQDVVDAPPAGPIYKTAAVLPTSKFIPGTGPS